LISSLENPNGWWRDQAQQLRFESGLKSIVNGFGEIGQDFQENGIWQESMPTLDIRGIKFVGMLALLEYSKGS